MFKYLAIICLLNRIYEGSETRADFGPWFQSEKGSVWPQPQRQAQELRYYSFVPKAFRIKIIGLNCSLLHKAVKRFIEVCKGIQMMKGKQRKVLKKKQLLSKDNDSYYMGRMLELRINLTEACELLPHLEMDESYDLRVAEIAVLHSRSIWGIIRGLETFSQMFYMPDLSGDFRINATTIFDFPHYKHRGLLLDTSRHYISVDNILTTLEAMAINKMNVFHWHIVDDQSFPFVSQKFPELSEMGAYYPTMVYTPEDVARIVEFATDRGIRVVPEFDVPGHTRSWGEAFPGLLTKCYQGFLVTGVGPMNPIANQTYKFLRDLFDEVQAVFPDNYVHIGGDEVDLDCWASNPVIREFIKKNGVTNIHDLHAIFMHHVLPSLNRSKIIVWQEVFESQVPLPHDSIVQVWKETNAVDVVREILLSKHMVVYSSPWYISDTQKDIEAMYFSDPRFMFDDDLAKGIIGGEACMWAEMVDDTNVISSSWPRASIVAEVLWKSPPHFRQIPSPVLRRLEEHTCRMRQRGINASPPNGPSFCVP